MPYENINWQWNTFVFKRKLKDNKWAIINQLILTEKWAVKYQEMVKNEVLPACIVSEFLPYNSKKKIQVPNEDYVKQHYTAYTADTKNCID